MNPASSPRRHGKQTTESPVATNIFTASALDDVFICESTLYLWGIHEATRLYSTVTERRIVSLGLGLTEIYTSLKV